MNPAVMDGVPNPRTPDDMRGLLAHILAGVAGGTENRWKTLVGPVQRVPTIKFVRFNWIVEPSGTASERAAIEQAVEIVRAEHPYLH